jgi:hypothetical protein
MVSPSGFSDELRPASTTGFRPPALRVGQYQPPAQPRPPVSPFRPAGTASVPSPTPPRQQPITIQLHPTAPAPAPAPAPAVNPSENYRRLLEDFDRQGQAGLQERFRTIGQTAARLGRLGSGMTSEDVQKAGEQFERDRMSFLADLADKAIDRNMQQAELEDRLRSSAFGRSLQEIQLEDALRNSEFNRNLARAQLTKEQADALQRAQEQAAASAGDLLRLYTLNRQRQPQPTIDYGTAGGYGGLGSGFPIY